MKPIGGYFELELRKGDEYHKNAIRLNTGRNALELILRVKKYKKVFIPYYTCNAILEPFIKLKIDYEFYFVDENLEPIFNYEIINGDEGFLYINYFGLKNSFILNLYTNCNNLIIDNSQAFYSLPILGIPTFYSCRKFFGLPDGAYLYLNGIYEFDFPQDFSSKRFNHLLKRIELGAEAGYDDYKINENGLIGQPIKQMSELTKALLCNIDYDFARSKRIENFLILHERLSKCNELEVTLDDGSVPMIYPFLSNKSTFTKNLLDTKIFVATYWPNVMNWSNPDSLEYKYASRLIPLPVDQRIDKFELDLLIKKIELWRKESF